MSHARVHHMEVTPDLTPEQSSRMMDVWAKTEAKLWEDADQRTTVLVHRR